MSDNLPLTPSADNGVVASTNDPLTLYTRPVSLDVPQRQPAILRRSDGETVLYAGKLSTLFGEPGCGKSWVALIAAQRVVHAGGRVLWWDFEDNPSTLAVRSKHLGFLDVTNADKLRFADAELANQPEAIHAFARWLQSAPNSLVVIDAAENAGCPSDGASVVPWYQRYVDPWRSAGAAVVVVDHVPKRRERRPRGAIGSQHKLARVDGAAIEVRGTPWTKGEGGTLELILDKDRPGDIPAAVRQRLAVVRGDYETISGIPTFRVTIDPPDPQATPTERHPVGANDRQILTALAAAGPDGIYTAQKVREAANIRNAILYPTLKRLEHDGRIEKRAKRNGQKGQGFNYLITAKGQAFIDDGGP